MIDKGTETTAAGTGRDKRDLPPAARRALAEAEARRAARKLEQQRETEIGGPKGPEPVRYGDWERKGRAIDF
ncbi:succinate dehydrogenase assembly factor 4 [Mesorhizobium sp. Z1-4]|uniref:DUF1674 domain-containing protein n=1 Tax=Mesorhizobium sp. Z1-4 TaxID=2448478 RepID=UPI000FDBEAB9|nr:succinate dehydrogenase assembly factor 4 [Mesorhizobium sp. Z1-4]